MVGTACNRVDRHSIVVVEPGEISEHACVQRVVGLGLVLQMPNERRRLAAKRRLHHQIRGAAIRVQQVRKQLLGQKGQLVRVDQCQRIRHKELQKLDKELAQELLEDAVVVNAHLVAYSPFSP